MYPAHAFHLFPVFPQDDSVFVAMSFDPQFETRWKDVIEPAIGSINGADGLLKPHRVDTRNVSDSILTEILHGIARARLVFADITSMGKRDEYSIRNGNVMYEIGIAHAKRLPEEVLLFRSDNDKLLFDVAGIRVRQYSPDDDPKGARQQIAAAAADALKEIDLRRTAGVEQAISSLSSDAFQLLWAAGSGLKHPRPRSIEQAVAAIAARSTISGMLDAGLLECHPPNPAPTVVNNNPTDVELQALFSYHLTPFGQTVLVAAAKRFGYTELAEGWKEGFEAVRAAKRDGRNR